MNRPRLDPYLLLAATSLSMTIPFSIAAFAHGKGVDVGDRWFFALLPGVGMAICGTAGNAAVVGALLTIKMSRRAQIFLALVALVSFVGSRSSSGS